MANILDYLDWRGDLSFRQSALNKIDFVAMTQLALINFDDILITRKKQRTMTIQSAYQIMLKKGIDKYLETGLIVPKTIIPMLEKMANCKRFKDLILTNYVNNVNIENETQFCALCVELNDTTRCIVYSGTDDTIIGWKENFNMLRTLETPAQIQAREYLEQYGKDIDNLYVVGHSKGGNLALHATLMVNDEIGKKIIKAYNVDGPGLTNDRSFYTNLDERIKLVTLIIPQTSVVGCLFDHYESSYIVHSNTQGLYQHDVFTWDVMGSHFIKDKGLTSDAIHIDNKVKEITSTLNEEAKDLLVESLYKVLVGNKNFKTLTEVSKSGFQVVKAYVGLNGETKKLFTKISNDLLKDKIILKNLMTNIKEYGKYNEMNNPKKGKITNERGKKNEI